MSSKMSTGRKRLKTNKPNFEPKVPLLVNGREVVGDGDQTSERREEKDFNRGEMLDQLYSEFPGLVMQDRDMTRWSLLVTCSPVPLLVTLNIPNFPSIRLARVTGGEDLRFLLPEEDLQQLVFSSPSLRFLLTALLARLTDKSSLGLQDLQTKVLEDLGEVGWNSVDYISPDLASAVLSTLDEKGNKHLLSVTFLPGQEGVRVSHQLPSEVWEAPSLPLPLIFSSWVTAVASLRPVWDSLRDLDRLCWVLDPDPPGPQHLYRRLVLSTSLSLHLTLDPACPTSLPSLKFLGADNRVAPLRQALETNIELWEDETPLINNLETVLDLELPSKTTSTREEWSVECGICYSYSLGDEGELPSATCDEVRCGQPYHPSCLYNWLTSQPGSRSAMNMAHGECPYCSKPINCSRPEE